MTTSEELVAPALSTYQDDDTFQFDKFQAKEKVRPHLGNPSPDELPDKVNEYYSLDKLAEILKTEIKDVDSKENYRRITLQFPDSLICDSATIVYELQKRLGITYQGYVEDKVQKECNSCEDSEGCCSGSSKVCVDNAVQKIWILADTSYSSCCVDEVAAQHVNSDLVIHFGDACLNPIEKLPAFYVFGKPKIAMDDLIQNFKQTYSDPDQKILLMADAPHTCLLESIYDTLKSSYPNIAFADLSLPNKRVKIVDYTPNASEGHILEAYHRKVIGVDSEFSLADYELFHITEPESPRLLQLTTEFTSVTLYNPQNSTIIKGPFPNLMRRYRYMQMARSAGTIGLLVNTLSLENTKKLLNKLKQKITEASKKQYMFVVGKPNVAKLANFEPIDIWCVLGCDQQGIVLDQSNEFFKPIITPYELLLSLNRDLSWSGKWFTNFDVVLKEIDNEANEAENDEVNEENDNSSEEESAPPEFDPVTGRYVSTSKPLRVQHLQISAEESNTSEDAASSELVKKFSNVIAIKNTVSTSAQHLQNRHWTGLGSDYNESTTNDEGALVEDGRKGVARSYNM